MTHERAAQIFVTINDCTKDDDVLLGLKRELWLLALRYARLRADWRMVARDERVAMDAARRRAHDALIDQCNILSLAAGRAGRDNHWRAALGEDRKEIGDFACHVHCILGVEAR